MGNVISIALLAAAAALALGTIAYLVNAGRLLRLSGDSPGKAQR
jgi:hypothetical protein